MLEKIEASKSDYPWRFRVTRAISKHTVPGLVGVVAYLGHFGLLSVCTSTVLDGEWDPCLSEGVVP